MGLSRQEHWSGLPFPSPGDLPDPGMEPVSLCLLYRRWVLYPGAARLPVVATPVCIPSNSAGVTQFILTKGSRPGRGAGWEAVVRGSGIGPQFLKEISFFLYSVQ